MTIEDIKNGLIIAGGAGVVLGTMYVQFRSIKRADEIAKRAEEDRLESKALTESQTIIKLQDTKILHLEEMNNINTSQIATLTKENIELKTEVAKLRDLIMLDKVPTALSALLQDLSEKNRKASADNGLAITKLSNQLSKLEGSLNEIGDQLKRIKGNG